MKTGFDSLKELGPKAIQLLPVFDQDNDERTTSTTENGVTTTTAPDYNWGYNPLNYNVVEGSYSSDPTSATTKISEFKNLVKQCADNDIRVIMDVVYNHMVMTSPIITSSIRSLARRLRRLGRKKARWIARPLWRTINN